jgi:hypothetical protein
MNDNREWHKCLQEACEFETNTEKLRELFAIILIQCIPDNPLDLWTTFKNEFSHDILLSQQKINPLLNNHNDLTYHTALYELDNILNRHGKSLKDFGLPVYEQTKVIKLNIF